MGGKIKIDKSRFGNLSVSFLKMDLCKRVNAEWYLDCVLYSCDFTDMRKFCGNNALIFLQKKELKRFKMNKIILRIKMYVLKVSI